MPRVHGVRERRHQPLYDTLIRETGAPAIPVQPRTQLFGGTNIGQLAKTNLQVAGQLASDQTYVCLAIRCWLYFDGTDSRKLYTQTVSQLFLTFTLGDKPQFQSPAWMFPAGGGLYGVDSTASVLNNGYPSQNSILKLARPIIIPVRQNVAVTAEFFAMGSTNVLDVINNAAQDTQQNIAVYIDGLQTRDVQ